MELEFISRSIQSLYTKQLETVLKDISIRYELSFDDLMQKYAKLDSMETPDEKPVEISHGTSVVTEDPLSSIPTKTHEMEPTLPIKKSKKKKQAENTDTTKTSANEVQKVEKEKSTVRRKKQGSDVISSSDASSSDVLQQAIPLEKDDDRTDEQTIYTVKEIIEGREYYVGESNIVFTCDKNGKLTAVGKKDIHGRLISIEEYRKKMS